MAIYAVAITPLIRQLQDTCPSITQCWYADDDMAADYLQTLRRYWDELVTSGPGFGYFPNASKTKLLVKPEYRSEANRLFSDTGVTVIEDGSGYLGGAVGQKSFVFRS